MIWSPLALALQTHRQPVDAMAAAWLAAGATAVGVWQGDRLLMGWPAGAGWVASSLHAAIRSPDGLVVGELRVGGVAGAAAEARLAADGGMLTALLAAGLGQDSLADALSEAEDQLLALYELTKADAGRLDIDRLLTSLVGQAIRLVKAEAAFAVLWPATVVQAPTALAADADLLALFERMRAAGHELLLSRSDVAFALPDAVGTLFLLPLLVRAQSGLVAALGLGLSRSAAALSPDLKLARSIAEQAGAQLEIALLHRERLAQARLQAEMELARRVQLDLLPRQAPPVMGLDLYAESQPALEVGGDFYDFYLAAREGQAAPPASSGHHFAFAVGDVSGKGMSAALLMATTRTTLRDAAREGMAVAPAKPGASGGSLSPREILARATEYLYDDFTEVGMLATAFVGRYHHATRTLVYANAGHAPVIYCPLGGGARLLEADGPALGVLPVCLSEDQRLALRAGDVVIAGTDGFSEAQNDRGEMFGYERLLRLTESIAGGTATAIGGRLFDAVRDFGGNRPQDDDQTLVVIKGTGP